MGKAHPKVGKVHPKVSITYLKGHKTRPKMPITPPDMCNRHPKMSITHQKVCFTHSEVSITHRPQRTRCVIPEEKRPGATKSSSSCTKALAVDSPPGRVFKPWTGMDNDKPVAHALPTACTHSDHSSRVTTGCYPDCHN